MRTTPIRAIYYIVTKAELVFPSQLFCLSGFNKYLSQFNKYLLTLQFNSAKI